MTEAGAGRRPTMRDVAREAGVSQALVSIVFRQAPGASPQTREKVFQAAHRLGYVRDERARVLRSRHSTSIGVCFQTRQPFHHEIIDGLYDATAGTGNHLVLSATSDSRSESVAVDDLMSYRCGVLVLLGSGRDPADLAKLARVIPVVSVARAVQNPDIDWVCSDDLGGIDQAVRHLVGLGHRRITYVTCPGAAGSDDRLRGFHQAAALHQLASDANVIAGGMTEQDGALVAHRLLAEGPLPTALIGFNDRCALGIIDVFVRAGVRVPRDVSVVGFDDSEIAQRPVISMTSVHQDTHALARYAAERAIDRLRAQGPHAEPRGIIVPTSLTVRSTTSPPRPSDATDTTQLV